MSQCEQYRTKIEEILRGSDLNTITTKFVRRSLEKQLGASLDPIKKDINDFIEEIFVDFQEKQEERTKQYLALVVKKEEQKEKKVPVVNNTVKKEKGNKVEKKTTTKKSKKEPGEKRQVNWPVYKIKSPLKEVIDSELCTRPATVKKLWEYIKGNNLQDPNNKSIIQCDEKFKALCDGQDTCTAFNMNKYISKYFENIDKEQQPHYKELYAKQEAAKGITA